MKYRDELDKSYGVAGMALGLTVFDADDLFTAVTLDGDGPGCIQFTPEFNFAGNPRLSARGAWQYILGHYRITVGLAVANALCRRMVLDNERVISEFAPGTVLRQSLQNRVMPYCKAPPSVTLADGVATLSAPPDAPAEGVLFVGGFFPGVHFSADIQSLSSGAAALLDFAPLDGSILFRVRAEPGKPVEFSETRGKRPLAAALANAQPVPQPRHCRRTDDSHRRAQGRRRALPRLRHA